MRYRREWNSVDAEDTANERHTIPIAKLQYRLTERTRFHLGIQGVGFFLPYRVEDSADSDRTFKQFDAVAMVSNNSKYFGYIVSTNAGVSRRNKEYENSEIGTVGDEEFVSAFVNVIVGFEAE